MPVSKVPSKTLRVLDSEQKITGYEILYVKTFVFIDPSNPTEDERAIAASFRAGDYLEDATAEQIAALEETSVEALTAENNRLNAQVADLQDQVKAAATPAMPETEDA